MTVFTVNPFDDGYFADGKPVNKFQQFCMRSWERLGCEIKVFDYNSPEVIEAKEKYKLWIDSAVKKGCISIASDPIRLYILSLYEDLLYFDTDVYVADPVRLKELENETTFKIRYHNFCMIHNGRRRDIARRILDECYMTDEVKGDKKVIKSSEFCLSLHSIQNGFTREHFPRIGEKDWDNLYVETYDETKKYMEKYAENPGRHVCFYSASQELSRELMRDAIAIDKKDENGDPLYQVKYLKHIPAEDFDEFRSFMDN